MGNNMQDRIKVLGIVLKAEPIGEYDRRVVILTREKENIRFCKGSQKADKRFSGSYQSVYLRDVRAVCRAKFLQRL